MAAQSYEFTGKTVDEAIADGLKTLSLRHDQVDIEVVNKGSRVSLASAVNRRRFVWLSVPQRQSLR